MLKKRFKENKPLKTENQLEEIIYEKIREILPADIRNVEINNEIKIEELGIDSIQYVNLLFSFEDIIEKDLEEIAEKIDLGSIRTIGDIVNLVKSLQE